MHSPLFIHLFIFDFSVYLDHLYKPEHEIILLHCPELSNVSVRLSSRKTNFDLEPNFTLHPSPHTCIAVTFIKSSVLYLRDFFCIKNITVHWYHLFSPLQLRFLIYQLDFSVKIVIYPGIVFSWA